MSRSTPLDQHENCSAAATLFEAGSDDDGDGVLSDAEVDTTILSCRNASSECSVTTEATQIRVTCTGKATQLIPIEPEKLLVFKELAADSTCLNGSVKLDVGLDDGQGAGEPGDKVLHADEVDASKTVCNPFCGDGTTDALEQCDDGNRDVGDGCDAACRNEPSCLAPTPDPACPPMAYFIDTVTLPALRSLDAFDVTLRGVFPEGTASAARVSDAAPLTVASATTGQVQVTIPPGSGSDALTLTISGTELVWLKKSLGADGSVNVAAAPIAYSYGAPVISSLSGCAGPSLPLSLRNCAAGSPITIVGQNFGVDASLISVSVGGAACEPVTLVGSDVTCLLPAGKGSNPVVVATNGIGGNPSVLAYVMPEITSVTFDASSPTPTSSTQTLTINGTHFGAAPVAKYGRDGHYFSCASSSATDTEIVCALEPGAVGSDLHFIVTDSVDEVASAPSAFSFSYSPPSIVQGSLRSSLAGPTGDTLALSSIGGEPIFFDVENLGRTSALTSVRVGDRPCVLASIFGAPTDLVGTIECISPPGEGTPTFSVSAGGQTATSADVLTYSVVPTVTSVDGECGGAVLCPRAGGALITISGQNFSQGTTTVFIDDAQCAVQYVSPVPAPDPSTILCAMPPGKGNATVRVFSNGVPSKPGSIQYALPSISSIAGCQNEGTTTINCPTQQPLGSTVRLTIRGNDFGPSNALVFVGPNLCEDVQLASNRSLTCILPAGTGLNQPVRVVNDGASPPFFISYQE